MGVSRAEIQDLCPPYNFNVVVMMVVLLPILCLPSCPSGWWWRRCRCCPACFIYLPTFTTWYAIR